MTINLISLKKKKKNSLQCVNMLAPINDLLCKKKSSVQLIQRNVVAFFPSFMQNLQNL